MIGAAIAVVAVVAVVLIPIVLLGNAMSRPCCGKPHDWIRHPDYFRSRVCARCARCETLARDWEFDGYDYAAISPERGTRPK